MNIKQKATAVFELLMGRIIETSCLKFCIVWLSRWGFNEQAIRADLTPSLIIISICHSAVSN